jgi:hypothetical protein
MAKTMTDPTIARTRLVKIKTSYALPTKDVRGNEPANNGTYNTQRNVEKKPLPWASTI